MSTTEIVLSAPLSGVIVPLDDVPDPVFAARMVGDGLSIDPTTHSLQAPCAGAVTMIHAAGHALTVAHDSGLEVLMHIGLDTVALKGQGFTPKVKVGDRVTLGQLLIEFDADGVARKAKSLLTEIIVLPPDRIASLQRNEGPIEAGDVLITVQFKSAQAMTAAGPAARSTELPVPNPQGLHARPAAVLAGVARRFQSETRIHRGDAHANVKSVVALMTMQVKQGDRVVFEAQGPDAEEAVAALAEALKQGLGEDPSHAPAPSTPAIEKPRPSDDPHRMHGVTASPGLAVGQIFQVRRQERHLQERAADPAAERRALQAALDHAVAELDDLERRSGSAIFAAHRELLQDPDVTDLVWRDIASGKSAAFAWHQACTNQAALLAALPDTLLSARANDVRDVRDRVLRLLLGEAPAVLELPPNAVVVAEDLTPSETASLDRSKVVGFATLLGGPTSHVAILARSLDLPALAAVDPRAAEVPDGTPAILDASAGALKIQPTAAETAEAEAQVHRLRDRRAAQLKQAARHATTQDGHRIEVVANLGEVSEAEAAVSNGAEGVGLLRSEFLFMDRPQAPTEQEQADAYVAVARALGPDRRLLIRTMDIGGDKPLPNQPHPP
ncbi:MAG TPA: glucose PTS transporter subunit IIA, partial [Candidatus Xenobia bacterium]